MSNLTLPRRRQTTLGAASAARAVAEAAFAAPRDEAAAAVVVIKRRRRAVNAGGAAPDAIPSAAAHSAREQRVFRLSASLVPGERSATTATSDLVASHSATAEAVAGSLESPSPAPRRQRRRKHGVVTVIRPDRLDEQEVKEVASRESLVGTPQSAPLPRDFDFLAARERCEQLRSQIVKLEREAQRLRVREVAHAVRWIRGAIEDYGLTAKDLGFK